MKLDLYNNSTLAQSTEFVMMYSEGKCRERVGLFNQLNIDGKA